jgi:prepilin-type N-terminal cleavage/methylation domain-containing protein
MTMAMQQLQLRRPRRPRRAFTLTELLVVMGIIIILALAAVPATRFIMGSRSIEGAQNIVTAMIGRARAQAVSDREPRGAFFFVDPATDRSMVAIIGLSGQGELDQYFGWTTNTPSGIQEVQPAANSPIGVTYYGPGNAAARVSAVVSLTSALFADANYQTYGPKGVSRYVVRQYGCISQPSNVPATNNRPYLPGGNPDWGNATNSIELTSTDFQSLPPGVGVQLLNDPQGNTNIDRYLRIGVILFDKAGHFTSLPWAISAGSQLGLLMHLQNDLKVNGLYSQFGVALYDKEAFLGAGYTDGDWLFDPNNNSGKQFFAFPPKFPNAWAQESPEENWLDQNSVPLLINRYDGTVIKGE